MSYDEAQLPNPMELPAVEQQSAHADMPENVAQQGTERNPEYLPPVQANQNNPTGQQQQNMPTHANPMPQPQDGATSAPQASLSTNAPAIADDVDLIEKEWVEKAKEIVEKTRDNPYLQNKAISEIKADYIKKRYNKDVSKSEQ